MCNNVSIFRNTGYVCILNYFKKYRGVKYFVIHINHFTNPLSL